jgi:hypothetical protein
MSFTSYRIDQVMTGTLKLLLQAEFSLAGTYIEVVAGLALVVGGSTPSRPSNPWGGSSTVEQQRIQT